MRGKLIPYLPFLKYFRITPAYAGKTPPIKARLYCPADHPRVCGENQKSTAQNREHRGSPPRMRGKLFPAIYHMVQFGITPAYAGKTGCFAVGVCILGDHPRVCGENATEKQAMAAACGSPPRMRGKPRRWCCEMFEYRITPAYAGKTAHSAPQ